MQNQEQILTYRHRLRVFLILYIFSEDYTDPSKPTYKKIFEGETKIQKIDFWLRNPDYFSYELLKVAKSNPTKKSEIRIIVKNIFRTQEPIIRRDEMEKFRFGAYQDLDDVIAFLHSIGLIKFDSKRALDSKIRDKKYYITEVAIDKIEKNVSSFVFLQWYIDRCNLIKTYFGDKSGTQLKDAQYEIEQYSGAAYGKPIEGISYLVEEEFYNIYNEIL